MLHKYTYSIQVKKGKKVCENTDLHKVRSKHANIKKTLNLNVPVIAQAGQRTYPQICCASWGCGACHIWIERGCNQFPKHITSTMTDDVNHTFFMKVA